MSRDASGPAKFWAQLAEDLSRISPDAEIRRNAFYSEAEWDIYEVRYNSLGSFRLFAWMSVPRDVGPFPSVVYMPDYMSVSEFPFTPLRREMVVINASHRGQRHNDAEYQADYPGLLTQGIDALETYAMKDVYADSIKAVDLLLGMSQVDRRRIAVAGDGLGGSVGLAAAAIRPEVRALAIESPMMIGPPEALDLAGSYPLDEVNDYLRTYPERRQAVLDTIKVFDPLAMAGNVTCQVLLGLSEKDSGLCPPPLGERLANRLSNCELRAHPGVAGEQGGRQEVVFRTNWIREQLGTA